MFDDGRYDLDENDFVVRENDDLAWLGFFTGNNEHINEIHIYHLPDKGRVEVMFHGFQRNKGITSVELNGENEEFVHEGISAMNMPHVTSICVINLSEGANYLALGLKGCKSLKQYDGPVTDEILASLSSLPMLESMSVTSGDDEAISQDACAALGELLNNNTTLKELKLNGVGLGDEELEELGSGLANNRSLTELHLCRNNVSDQGAAALAASLVYTHSFEVLAMSDNNIGDEGLAALASFVAASQKLKTLRLSNNSIGDQGVEALASALSRAPNRSRLRRLSLDGNTMISARGFGAIARILQSRKCNIDDLNLGSTSIGQEGGAFLGSGLSCNKSLLVLSLCDASIDDTGLRNLVAGLSSNTSLRELNLSSNTSITAVGLSHFKLYFQSPNCALRTLSIYNIRFGDEGALALVDAMAHNKSLEELRFLGGESSDVSVTGMKAFSKLVCDSSTPNNAYLSNHTLRLIGYSWGWFALAVEGWSAVADEYLNNISPWLELNKNSSSSNAAAKSKVLSCFPGLNMTPLLKWDLKFLPFAKAWFQCIKAEDKGKFATIIRSRELSVIYSFVRGMPVLVADDSKQYLTEQLNILDATKRKLEEEIQAIEEAKCHLVQG
jgi:Ran GTPase-activating protein (RanGAP) involved in mRNA processing and transport